MRGRVFIDGPSHGRVLIADPPHGRVFIEGPSNDCVFPTGPPHSGVEAGRVSIPDSWFSTVGAPGNFIVLK